MGLVKFIDSGRGPTVLWVHGYPLSGKIFASQSSMPGFRHVIPDLPGFGSTPARGPRSTIDDFADAVLKLADDRRVSRFVLAGHSMGGYIALAIMRKAADRVGALILLDTKEIADTDKARADRLKTIQEVEKGGPGVVVEAMLPKLLGAQTSRSNPALVREVRQILETASPDGITSALSAMASRPDSTAAARSTKVPTLIIAGADDTLTPVSDAERMHGLIEGSELVIIPGAGHLPTMENSQLTTGVIAEFLANQASLF